MPCVGGPQVQEEERHMFEFPEMFVNKVIPEAREDPGLVGPRIQTIWGTIFKKKNLKSFLL